MPIFNEHRLQHAKKTINLGQGMKNILTPIFTAGLAAVCAATSSHAAPQNPDRWRADATLVSADVVDAQELKSIEGGRIGFDTLTANQFRILMSGVAGTVMSGIAVNYYVAYPNIDPKTHWNTVGITICGGGWAYSGGGAMRQAMLSHAKNNNLDITISDMAVASIYGIAWNAAAAGCFATMDTIGNYLLDKHASDSVKQVAEQSRRREIVIGASGMRRLLTDANDDDLMYSVNMVLHELNLSYKCVAFGNCDWRYNAQQALNHLGDIKDENTRNVKWMDGFVWPGHAKVDYARKGVEAMQRAGGIRFTPGGGYAAYGQ